MYFGSLSGPTKTFTEEFDMRTYTYRDMDKCLRGLGWKEIRCKGSHHQYRHPSGSVVTVPGRRSSEVLSDNVVKNIEKAMSLPQER